MYICRPKRKIRVPNRWAANAFSILNDASPSWSTPIGQQVSTITINILIFYTTFCLSVLHFRNWFDSKHFILKLFYQTKHNNCFFTILYIFWFGLDLILIYQINTSEVLIGNVRDWDDLTDYFAPGDIVLCKIAGIDTLEIGSFESQYADQFLPALIQIWILFFIVFNLMLS